MNAEQKNCLHKLHPQNSARFLNTPSTMQRYITLVPTIPLKLYNNGQSPSPRSQPATKNEPIQHCEKKFNV